MTDDQRILVLTGRSEHGYQWQLEAGGNDEDFMTMMSLFRDGRLLHSGNMRGPKLRAGSVMHEYRGHKDSLPYVIVVRTAPHVERVVVTTDRGTDIDLPMSQCVEQFGLRFTAAVLPDGHGPHSIRAEANGQLLQTMQQRMPGPRPPGGSGWIRPEPG